MAANTANLKVSNLVNSQVPFFVRNDHPTFVTFLQVYFQYLEQYVGEGQLGKLLERRENLLKYIDIDTTIEDFEDFLYTKFLKGFSIENTYADKDVILKHAKDFYRAKGSEKSIRFLMRILFGPDQDDIEFYYPKKDILKASDGKWYIQKSLRVRDTSINGTANNTIAGLEKFAGKRVYGATSDASAIIESVNRFYQQSAQLDELILSDIKGTFTSGETISTTFNENGSQCTLSANVFGGSINSIVITNPGTRYTTNDTVIIESSTGTNAVIRIAKVSAGNISLIQVNDGGAGYQNGSYIIITGGGGYGANANVRAVSANGYAHPSSYNIISTTIQTEANVTIGNTTYSNLMIGTGNTYNMSNRVAQVVSAFTYANAGPVANVLVILSGQDFDSQPTFEVQANSRIRNLGIIGKLKINNGGFNYANGDILVFNNVPGGYGSGANGTVTMVDANGTIMAVALNASPTSNIIGGTGYDLDHLPTVSIRSSNTLNSGANVTVSTLLGYGGDFTAISGTLGAIERMIIINEGQGYLTAPTINLRTTGDGTAQAYVTTLQGIFSYPGRYLNDDGFLSSYNFLEDRDYYQPFSYVIRARESISKYRSSLKELAHPAGFKVFGEYLYSYNGSGETTGDAIPDSTQTIFIKKPYTKNLQTVNVAWASHTFAVGNTVYMEYTSGGFANVRNGYYTVAATGTNWFTITQKSNIANLTVLNTGARYNTNSYIIFTDTSGNGANATFTRNAAGNITSTTIIYRGDNYTLATTATANGTNSNPATFTVTLSQLGNTSGNVMVGKIVT